MGGLKRYYVNVRTIAVSEEWNFRIRVTPAHNRNELPYFEAVTPIGLWLPQEPYRSAYFHFRDSQMEFFKNGDLQWKIRDEDMEHIREVLQKDNVTDRGYTNWQMACYWWNVEHDILDFGTPPEQYFQGMFDKANEKNRSYIPHDQRMPETWIYAPPRKIKKRMIIGSLSRRIPACLNDIFYPWIKKDWGCKIVLPQNP